MKVLSIKQPWASLIIFGGKDIEKDVDVSEPMFLEWCEKQGWFWAMVSQDDRTFLLSLLSKTGSPRKVTVSGSTTSESRARAIVEASK